MISVLGMKKRTIPKVYIKVGLFGLLLFSQNLLLIKRAFSSNSLFYLSNPEWIYVYITNGGERENWEERGCCGTRKTQEVGSIFDTQYLKYLS